MGTERGRGVTLPPHPPLFSRDPCDEGDHTAWSGLVSFTTGYIDIGAFWWRIICNRFSIPLRESGIGLSPGGRLPHTLQPTANLRPKD